MDKFISVIDHNGRTSTLSMEPTGLQVIGNLPHGHIINPKTKEDAAKLITFLQMQIFGIKK